MNVYQLLSKTVKETPDHIAIVEEDASVTYQSLEKIINDIGEDLHEIGIRNDHLIGLFFPNSLAYIAITYALWRLDAAVVPIDTELKDSEVKQICDEMQLSWIISFAETPGSTKKKSTLHNTTFYYKKLQPAHGTMTTGKQIAFVRFTSGTTGSYKGVVLTHEKIIQRIDSVNKAMQISPNDTVIWLLSMAHHFVSTIVLYLSKGATIVLVKGLWTGAILKVANRMKATLIYASPFHYSMLANDQSGLMLPDIRLAISTTINLPDSVYEKFLKRYEFPVVQAYGIIEIGLICINTLNAERQRGSVGPVLPDYQLKINPYQQEAVSRGSNSGELLFKGPGFFDAYFDPWVDSKDVLIDGWFKTGDIGRVDEDGHVYIIGRKNDVINTAGMKVFPMEIETQLNQHPKISESYVYGKKNDRLGELVAADIVLQKANETITETEIKTFCRRKIASYKVPERIRIVQYLKKTPVTSKIIRIKPS